MKENKMRIEISRVWHRELSKYKLEKNPFATIEEKRDGIDHYAIAELGKDELLDFIKWIISHTGYSVVIEDDCYFDKQESDLILKIYDDYME